MLSPRETELLDKIIRREGGYVDLADDRGGPTKYGITLATLAESRGINVTAADVRDLTEEEARTIYLQRYIRGPHFDLIQHDALFDLLVDTGVNNGRDRAAKWLQRSAGVVEDGVLGPVTLGVVNANPIRMYYRLIRVRLKAYAAIVAGNTSQRVFAAGWMNRVAEFLEKDLV